MASIDERASPSDPRIDTMANERYRFVRLVGEGGMGRVYEALDLERNSRVALKTLAHANDAAARVRFEREAHATASLVHPNIVEVFDVGQLDDGSPYIAMELLEGESLGVRLDRCRRLALVEAIAIVVDVARGLDAAHAAGIVHRDLKPENVFLQTNGTAKILDFGISKFHGAVDSRTVTETGAPMGTPRYMAPEQIEGLTVDARTDVYALGVLLHRALAGVEPFIGTTHHLLAYRILAEEPPPLRRLRPDVPSAVESAVLRALSKSPDDRFESASFFAEALMSEGSLEGLESVRSTTRSAPIVVPRVGRARRRMRFRSPLDLRESLVIAVVFVGSFGLSLERFEARTSTASSASSQRVATPQHVATATDPPAPREVPLVADTTMRAATKPLDARAARRRATRPTERTEPASDEPSPTEAHHEEFLDEF